MQMMPSRDELIEKMAEVIWEANDRKGVTWAELLVLNSADGYLNAKTTVRIVRKQATAVLQALLESLPKPKGQYCNVMPLTKNSPRELWAAQYYKQLIGMKK